MSFPVGANRYAVFREQILSETKWYTSKVQEPEEPFDIPEMELQAIWFGGELGRKFTGTEGEAIEVVQFGHWNRGAGPDFTEVAVKIDGQVLSGSLEIDLDCRSWEDHKHGANLRFDNVVLHVFLKGSPRRFYTRNSNHKQITQLQIDWSMLRFASVQELPEAYPGRCLAPLRAMPEAAVSSMVESAAQFRVQNKMKRLQAMARATSDDQALYQGVAEALGYRANRVSMAILAQRCAIGTTRKLSSPEREARLFGMSGLIGVKPRASPHISDESAAYIKQLWSEWWKARQAIDPLAQDRTIAWQTSGSRPFNHPQRRIGALAVFSEHWSELRACLQEASGQMSKQFESLCESLEHPFWNFHYTLTSVASDRPLKLIGVDRSRDILGNILLPWCLSSREHLWPQYMAIPAVNSNEKLRRACLRLFGDDKGPSAHRFTRKYFQQQALLQIYQDFCLVDRSECEECPFPEQMQQWR